MNRSRERRMLVGAIVASIVLHVVVAFSLAAFGSVLNPPTPLPQDEAPPEMTLMDLSTPPPVQKVNTPFVETPEARKSERAPDEKTFESNENSLAASANAANGNAPVPTTDGVGRPGLDFTAQNYSLPNQGAKPQPSAAPSATPPPTPQPTPTPVATATPEPEQLAMLRPTPPPAFTPPEATPSPSAPQMRDTEPQPRPTPAQPASDYQRMKIPTRLSGNISTRGAPSLNAVGTPLGRYQKLLSDAVGKNWYANVEKQRDLVNIGSVHLRFVIDRSGRIDPAKMKVISNSSNEAFAGVCIASVQDVRLPALSDDIASALPPEGLEVDFNFTMAPNR